MGPLLTVQHACTTPLHTSVPPPQGPRYRPSAEKLSRLLFGKHAAVLGCLQASVEGTPCSQSCCQFWNPDNQVPPRGWIAPPQRRRFPAATPEDVALIVQLYGWGYSIMHPHDTRHCKEVLPYDKNAMQLLRDLDMERIPAQLIGVLTEAAQRQSWNGSITIEVPSTFFFGFFSCVHSGTHSWCYSANPNTRGVKHPTSVFSIW